MKPIPVGAQGSFSLVVTAEHLANRFKDSMLPAVLATPVMVLIMENAALNAIKPYLEGDESAVGTRVDVTHLAATPVGMTATAHAEVTRVDGRRIEFRVEATDGLDLIGTAIHERMLIDMVRFNERLQQKADRAAGK
ncbi:MAG: thioesterase family protein [Betaproteobacteria bacterium]|nr:thioesterase family protein [Betaproteobacteria bacterium]